MDSALLAKAGWSRIGRIVANWVFFKGVIVGSLRKSEAATADPAMGRAAGAGADVTATGVATGRVLSNALGLDNSAVVKPIGNVIACEASSICNRSSHKIVGRKR